MTAPLTRARLAEIEHCLDENSPLAYREDVRPLIAVAKAARELLASLHECERPTPVAGGRVRLSCERPATRWGRDGSPLFCDEHAPEGCTDLNEAPAIRALLALLGES